MYQCAVKYTYKPTNGITKAIVALLDYRFHFVKNIWFIICYFPAKDLYPLGEIVFSHLKVASFSTHCGIT